MPYRINATGLAEIENFLRTQHKRQEFTTEQLNAWAADAEFQLEEGNPATIEIRSWDSLSGHTETFTISDAGIDFPPDAEDTQ